MGGQGQGQGSSSSPGRLSAKRVSGDKGNPNLKKRRATSGPGSKSAGEEADIQFVSGLSQCETKTISWDIRNISELLELSEEDLKESGITFNTGQSIGIPATWNFFLDHADGWIGGYLELSFDSEVTLVKAKYSFTLSCEGETIAFVKLPMHEYDVSEPLEENEEDFDYYEQRRREEQRRKFRALGLPYFTPRGILQETNNGKKALKVTLRLEVFSEKDPGPFLKKTPLEKLLEKEDLSSDLGKMLESGDGADVLLRVPNEVHGDVDDSSYTRKAHKGILMTKSTVFSAMFAEGSEMAEAQTGEVVIKDMSPKGLDIFLQFLYTGELSEEWVKVPMDILNTGEKYNLDKLKQFCGQNFSAVVTPSNAMALHEFARIHNLPEAREAVAGFLRWESVFGGDEGEGEGNDPDQENEPSPWLSGSVSVYWLGVEGGGKPWFRDTEPSSPERHT